MLLFMDGFDHYNNANSIGSTKWTNFSNGFAAGRLGGQCSETFAGTLRKVFPAASTVILGFAYKTYITSNIPIAHFEDVGNNAQVTISRASSGAIEFRRGSRYGTLLFTTTATELLPQNVWVYVEIKATIHDTTGYIEVRVNGISQGVFNGNTRTTANNSASTIMFGDVGNYMYYDDVYVCNDAGSVNNDFLGDVRVIALMPNGAGDTTQFTPSAGANWQCVDETVQNGDTDYVSSNTAGHRDLYAISDMTYTPQSIKAVQVGAVLRKDDAGARTVSTVLKSGGVVDAASPVGISTDYQFIGKIYENNPDGSVPWVRAAVDALQAGVEIAS
jgi:hypothetical protein